MRWGVAFLVFLVHLVLLSIVQDYIWVLFDFSGAQNPLPPVSSAGALKTIGKAREERGIDSKGGDASADTDGDGAATNSNIIRVSDDTTNAAESKDGTKDGSMHMATQDDREDAGDDF